MERGLKVAALEKEILTLADVAAILAMKESTIGDYARRGLIPSFKVGRHRRFRRSEIQEWIETQTERNPYR